ncbi:MAG TPA: hypothetical protein VMF53_15580 [Alphaproteobacteria bacterium]|nr:hypothetical protein [Alphaproteobacteria bacterium]
MADTVIIQNLGGGRALYRPLNPFAAGVSAFDIVWMTALILTTIGVFYALGYKFRSYLGHRRRE